MQCAKKESWTYNNENDQSMIISFYDADRGRKRTKIRYAKIGYDNALEKAKQKILQLAERSANGLEKAIPKLLQTKETCQAEENKADSRRVQ